MQANDCRPPYTLALLGIPPNGAKSRVETQIKLDLQLLHPGTDESVKNVYNYIKLPSYGVSKEKFRLKNLKGIESNQNNRVGLFSTDYVLDGPKELDPQKVLHL